MIPLQLNKLLVKTRQFEMDFRGSTGRIGGSTALNKCPFSVIFSIVG
jgi:hypothetical protein